jgi:hypothetical protein
MGKPIRDALGEINAMVEGISYYAEAIDKRYGEVAPTPHDGLGFVVREPVGVVGAVTPWNYPLNMAAWKLGPALATGNSVVLKPAEQTPLCGIRLVELGFEAGLPAGVLNVVPGFGHTAGAALGRRCVELHRLDGDRQVLPALLGREQHEAGLAGVRWQVPQRSRAPGRTGGACGGNRALRAADRRARLRARSRRER